MFATINTLIFKLSKSFSFFLQLFFFLIKRITHINIKHIISKPLSVVKYLVYYWLVPTVSIHSDSSALFACPALFFFLNARERCGKSHGRFFGHLCAPRPCSPSAAGVKWADWGPRVCIKVIVSGRGPSVCPPPPSPPLFLSLFVYLRVSDEQVTHGGKKHLFVDSLPIFSYLHFWPICATTPRIQQVKFLI